MIQYLSILFHDCFSIKLFEYVNYLLLLSVSAERFNLHHQVSIDPFSLFGLLLGPVLFGCHIGHFDFKAFFASKTITHFDTSTLHL